MKRLFRIGLPATIAALTLAEGMVQGALADPRDFTLENDLLVVTEDGSKTRKNQENLCTTSVEYYSED